MSLDPNTTAPNTTASIIATGVSLGCIDDRQKRWEVGFIGADRHDMTISIIKKAAGGDITVLPKTPIAHGSEISVKLVGGSASTSPGGSHQGDFKEILDIDKKVHPNPLAEFMRPTSPVTSLTVSPAAKLYAHTSKSSKFPIKLTKKGDETPIHKLDVIPTAAGTDITYREGTVAISIKGPTTAEYSVPNEPGFRFEVWFDNTCPPVTSQAYAKDDGRSAVAATAEKLLPDNSVETVENHSDFVFNYHVLNVPENEQRDLKRDEPPGRGEGAICNYSHLGERDGMFPLPS